MIEIGPGISIGQGVYIGYANTIIASGGGYNDDAAAGGTGIFYIRYPIS